MFIYAVIPYRAIPQGTKFDCKVQYCDGPEDYAGAGVGAACMYDVVNDRLEFVHARTRYRWNELVEQYGTGISYGGSLWDDHLLKAMGWRLPKNRWDIHTAIWNSVGIGELEYDPILHGGYELWDMVRVLFEKEIGYNEITIPVELQRRKWPMVATMLAEKVRWVSDIAEFIYCNDEEVLCPRYLKDNPKVFQHPEKGRMSLYTEKWLSVPLPEIVRLIYSQREKIRGNPETKILRDIRKRMRDERDKLKYAETVIAPEQERMQELYERNLPRRLKWWEVSDIEK